MEDGGAYGAGKAGAPFDPIAYLKKPQVILRIVSWFFAIIVFGCISAQGSWQGRCMFNGDGSACGFGTFVGVVAFLACIGFLVLDALFDNISSIQHRKWAVIADMVFSGVWTFMWFVCFCYLADRWRANTFMPKDGHGRSGVEAAIAFSFFSIISWAGLTVFAVKKYRQGASEAFTSQYDPSDPNAQHTPSPYSSYPGDGAMDPYQQPPFSGGPGGGAGQQQPPMPQHGSEYQPPTY